MVTISGIISGVKKKLKEIRDKPITLTAKKEARQVTPLPKKPTTFTQVREPTARERATGIVPGTTGVGGVRPADFERGEIGRARGAEDVYRPKPDQGPVGTFVGEVMADFRNTGFGAEVSNAMDTLTVAFNHPFKTIGAIFSPKTTIAGVKKEHFAQPIATQVGETVVATAGYAAAVVGVGNLITALTAKGGLLAGGQVLNGGTATQAATGHLIPGTLIAAPPTASTATLTAAYLAKLSLAAASPFAVLGIVGTVAYTSLFWGPNEKGDAITLLSVAQKEAARAGDKEMVDEIAKMIEDVYDINAHIPVVGFLKAETAKFEAGLISSKVAQRALDLNLKAAEEKLAADALIYGAIDPETGLYVLSPTEEAKRLEAEDYWEGLQKERREEEEDYWEKIQEEKDTDEILDLLEILAKRDSGQLLTMEEKNFLIAEGFTIEPWDVPYGRSALSFGLL